MTNSSTVELTIELMRRPSITPNEAGCLHLIAERLTAFGFNNEWLSFGEVQNLWSRRGHAKPLLVFAGHVDVVPTGPVEKWRYDPFQPTIEDGYLYGRGASDMKSGVAAMVTAAERFVTAHPEHAGSIAFLLTSDEEGVATHGTVKVVETLMNRGETIDWCMVGEPSSKEKLGDILKNGRRGSLTGRLTIQGVQGHIAYPELADNPIHRFAPILNALCTQQWDRGNAFFPPTTFQISNINAGTGATNVIPNHLNVIFNFRYSTEVTHDDLKQKISELLNKYPIQYDLTWEHGGLPFLTAAGELLDATQAAVHEVCGYHAQLSTAGGTSDGRFIAPTGAQVIELGVNNTTIHKVNECVSLTEIDTLSEIYQRILARLLL
jgi:succinyl-diaminopimelate desuccinylase